MKFVVHFVLPLAVMGAAAIAARQLILTAPTTEPKPVAAVAPLVHVTGVEAFDGATTIVGNGIVEPEREARIAAEITGKLTFVSDQLVEGARVQGGQVLLKIDGSAYKAVVQQQRAQVKQAELNLELEQNAAEAARREWAVSGQAPPEDARRIALRKPQVEGAEASIDVAKSAVATARLNLDRTTIRAPFNASVTAEAVEKGDVVNPGAVMATLVGIDRFIARISLPVEQLALLRIPRGPEGEGTGSPVTVVQTLSAGTKVVRSGHVLRLVTSLDGQSRTAQLLVAIDAPLDPADGELPLLVGSFIEAQIEGRRIDGAVSVPRAAVFGGNRVWTVDADDTLRERELTIAFGNQDRVIVTKGLEVGDRVVTHRLPVVTEGMKVRVDEPPDEADA